MRVYKEPCTDANSTRFELRRIGTELHSSWEKQLCRNDEQHTNRSSSNYFDQKMQKGAER